MRLLEQGRTRLVGAAIGTCLVTAVGVTSVFAQEATPEPSPPATPSAGTADATPGSFRASAAERTALAEQVQHVTDTIAIVQADRDAVGGDGDWTAVDDLLAKATHLRDAARATLEGDDPAAARQQLVAAQGAAIAAESLIRAQFADYGLPSQQAGASRTLVAAYNLIREASDRVDAGTDERAKAFATTAQDLYQTAYDLYDAGTYAQAVGTADVAVQVAGLAELLAAGGGVSSDAPNRRDVVVEGGKDPGFGWGVHVERAEVRGRGDPVLKAEPGFAGVVVLEPALGAGGFSVGGPGLADFSNESPLDVPAPDFD